jgi:quercetin dioxygenase-like cupin family protein
MVTHSGQEINYCLCGKMLLLYNGGEVELSDGDCAYFDARKPHGQMASGDSAARFLTVINE